MLASGRGSNFQALVDGTRSGKVNAEIKVLITDNPEAQAIGRAKKAKIPVEIMEQTKFSNREALDEAILQILQRYGVELVVLAGYMKIIKSKKLLDAYKYRMINVHPSLLPAFAGTTHAQRDAFEYGCQISGLTIHFVTDDLDHGPIVYQEAVDIGDCRDVGEVTERILKREHTALCKVVDSFSKGKYSVEGRKIQYAQR